MASLLDKLRYSAEDKRNQCDDLSGIPIDGDYRKGLASYRSAVRLYRKYLDAGYSPAAKCS